MRAQAVTPSTKLNKLIGSAGIGMLLVSSLACDPPGKPTFSETRKLPEQISDFKTLFDQNCAGCHGDYGKNGPGRILNDALYLNVLPKETLRQILIHGRAGTSMPPWAKSEGGPLTPKQIDILVDGIREWSKPVNLHGTTLPSYEASAKGDVDAGKKLFGRNCYICHGPGAKVGPVTDANYLSLVSNQMLRTSIIVGRPDLGMPDYRTLKLGKPLTDQDVTDLVAFLASRRPPESPLNTETPNLSAEAVPTEASSEQKDAAEKHTNDAGAGKTGDLTKGNEGSGNGPGSPRKERKEGNKGTGASSQQAIK